MNPTPLGLRGAYDTLAAAEYLSCSVDIVERLINEGYLASYLPRGMKRGRRINIEELDRYRLESAAQADTPHLTAVPG